MRWSYGAWIITTLNLTDMKKKYRRAVCLSMTPLDIILMMMIREDLQRLSKWLQNKTESI